MYGMIQTGLFSTEKAVNDQPDIWKNSWMYFYGLSTVFFCYLNPKHISDCNNIYFIASEYCIILLRIRIFFSGDGYINIFQR